MTGGLVTAALLGKNDINHNMPEIDAQLAIALRAEGAKLRRLLIRQPEEIAHSSAHRFGSAIAQA